MDDSAPTDIPLWAQHEAVKLFEAEGAPHGVTVESLTNSRAGHAAMCALARLIAKNAK